jgi:hypothetical protein
MATSRQRHCNSQNVRRKRCCRGSADGAVTSNRARPYSEFPKICQMVPIVLSVIPTVPGGGLGTTVTGQPTLSSSDWAATPLGNRFRAPNCRGRGYITFACTPGRAPKWHLPTACHRHGPAGFSERGHQLNCLSGSGVSGEANGAAADVGARCAALRCEVAGQLGPW